MMNKSIWQRLVAAPLVAALIFTAIVPAAVLAQETAAAQPARSAEATGTLPGGSFAKIWLGLTPVNPGTVTLRAEWDRENAGPSGIGFYVLDENNLAAVVNGASLPANNVGAGNSNFYLNGPSNVQGTSFRATGTSYTVVLYNDSNGDANFSLSVDNGLLSDDNNQVTLVGVESATPEATEEGATAPAASETTAAATAVATAAATTVAATTATTTTTTAPAEPAAVTAPAGGPVRAETMQGELPNQFDQHFLALEPTIKDGDISLELTYDPQDSTELARRINFWVLDQTGFTRFQAGDSPSSVAIAAGSKSFLDPDNSNKRVAAFKATGFGPYTVIVQNNSRVPATYNLTVTGGELIDDSAQTLTAQQAGGAAAAPAADTTTDAAATTTTPATTTTAATTTTPAAGTGVAGQPGGTYVIKEGDTLAIIARDLYGDFRLYEQLCAFNQIADCNVIEVGQTINLPTAEQIGATTTAAAATPAAAATTAAAAATPAATAAAVATAATTTTTTAPAASTAVTTTAAVTRTTATTATTAVGATTPATGTAATTTAAGSIVDVAEDNGNFTILIEALQKTGLDEELGGGGPFTVFAPTDAAFTAWLEKNNVTEETLLRASDLPAMLQYHVLSGKVLAADLTNGLKVTTLQGQPVTFKIVDGKVYVNDSQVVTTDIQTANGVIHTIDQPMLVPLSQ